jgi:hypothetical protein
MKTVQECAVELSGQKEKATEQLLSNCLVAV